MHAATSFLVRKPFETMARKMAPLVTPLHPQTMASSERVFKLMDTEPGIVKPSAAITRTQDNLREGGA